MQKFSFLVCQLRKFPVPFHLRFSFISKTNIVIYLNGKIEGETKKVKQEEEIQETLGGRHHYLQKCFWAYKIIANGISMGLVRDKNLVFN